MGADSKIEWTHHTFNPWRGCTKISPGCANCYAEKLSHRNPTTLGVWGNDGVRSMASESYWREPPKWEKASAAAGERHRVFCSSLADVFEDRPELAEPRHRLLLTIRDTPNLDWLLLTKRPENINRLLYLSLHTDIFAMPKNIWLGVSVEDQIRADERIPLLLQSMPASVKFLSCEPLLGPIDLSSWIYPFEISRDQHGNDLGSASGGSDIGWVIVGGESGPEARPMHPAWALSLRDQCLAAGMPFHFKQWGEWAPSGEWYDTAHCKLMNQIDGRLVPVTMGWGNWHDFEHYASVRRFGKVQAGRLLDGRTWDEFPEVL